MAGSKEEQLFEASTSGNLEIVKRLANDPSVNVNWGDPEHDRTAFLRACFCGHLAIVEFLLRHPRVDVNKQQKEGATPFLIASCYGHPAVVSLLQADMRINVNTPTRDLCSPLWFAAMNGHLHVVQVILVSGREVGTKIKSIAGPSPWSNKTAAGMARFQGTRTKDHGESDDEYARGKQNGPLIATLLESFDADPATTRQQLRELPELRDPFISDLFALVIFLCDDLLAVRAKSSPFGTSIRKAARFFQIVQRLPMELQMVLCNRVFGAAKNSVLTKDSEPAFKKLGRLLARENSR